MNGQFLVSIIISTYNGEKYIKRAIKSVLNQTYQNIEIVVIDDGSIDETYKIISELSSNDSRIIILKNENNLGFVKSLNKAISVSKGKYIARLDDDDLWIDERKLEKQVEFLDKHQDYALTGGGVIMVDKDGKEIVRYLLSENDKEIRKSILVDNAFAHSSVVFRKNIFEEVGGYDEKFGFFTDRDLWLKIGKRGKFYNFQEYFIYYLNKENENYNARNRNIRRKLMLNIELRKKYRNNYPGFSKAFFLCFTSYFYSFIPFRRKFRSILFKIRTLIVGPPAYKYFKK